VVKFPGAASTYPPPDPLPERSDVTAEQWDELKQNLRELGIEPPGPKPDPLPDPLDKPAHTDVQESPHQERSV
jgi:hypothetical protein